MALYVYNQAGFAALRHKTTRYTASWAREESDRQDCQIHSLHRCPHRLPPPLRAWHDTPSQHRQHRLLRFLKRPLPRTTSPLQSPLSALAADRMGREDAASAAHASRTPPGTERGCGESTAEVPNTAADAAASAPPSTPSAPNSENCSLLSCLLSRDLYRVVFASEGCEACLIVRSPP